MKFSEVPLHAPFWDPFIQRAFVKIGPEDAKCLTFPVDWTVHSNEFGPEEDVTPMDSLDPYTRVNLNPKCANILLHSGFFGKKKGKKKKLPTNSVQKTPPHP